METALLNRYNQPIPRYTSYPTVPFWKDVPAPHGAKAASDLDRRTDALEADLRLLRDERVRAGFVLCGRAEAERPLFSNAI